MSLLPSREHLLKRVAIRAATAPQSLFLIATGLLLVVSPVAWPAGLGALALEGWWLWSRIRDPSLARSVSDEMLRRHWQELIARLQALSASMDRETAATLQAIVESQERLIVLPGAGDASGESTVPHTRAELTSLLQHCLALAEKRSHIQLYLAAVPSQELQKQALSLQERVDRTGDPVTQGLYEQALEQKRQELENYARLQATIERIDGQLAAVRCTFDNLLGKVVRMHSAEAAATQPGLDPVYSELTRLTLGVAALEESINETLGVRGAA